MGDPHESAPASIHSQPAVIIDSRSAEFKGIPMSSDIFFALYMLNLVEC